MASCWKRFLGIGLLILFLSFLQFQLLFLSSSPSSPISAISSSQQIAIQSARPLQTAILLQISPVDPSHRLHRLLAIDRGWAIWQYPKDSNSPTFDIYAPHFQSMDHDFQNIQVIPVTGVNPFVRMIEGFFAVILKSSPKYDWILFGNDHTFLIPANLHCYLKKCDKNSLLYTGNRLHVTFRGKFINFASGGAGAVLSRPALISILAVWTVLHPSMINEILGKFSLERNFNKVPPDLFQQNVTISTVDGFFSDYEIFSLLSNWTENFSLKGDDCRRITLIFSSTRSLSFVMSFVSQKPILTAKYVDSSISKLSPASILTQYCSCSTTWDYDNPGIILAACLQEVFGVTLLPAQSYIDPTQELFNVYGLVRTVNLFLFHVFSFCR